MSAHVHAYQPGQHSKGKVEVCECGKFRFTEKAGPSIVEQTAHTPTPWRIGYNPRAIYKAHTHFKIGEAIEETDAAFIVTAVNAHAEMLAMLKTCREMIVTLLDESDPAWHTQFDGGAEQVEALDALIAKAGKL